jgi:DTW domain-containing protein YfiP
MAKRDDFVKLITEGYTYKGELILGCYSCRRDFGKCLCKNTSKTLNRHGLIAGATGTGNKKLFRFYLNSYLPLAFQC